MCSEGYNKKVPQRPQPCPNKRVNRNWCRARNGKNFKNCVFDLCQGLTRRDEIRIKHEVKKENKKHIHFNWNKWNHKRPVRPHRPVHRPHRPVHRPIHRPVHRPHRPIHRPVRPHRPVHRPVFRPHRPVFRPHRPVFRPVQRPHNIVHHRPRPTPRPTPRPVFIAPPRPTPRPVWRPTPRPAVRFVRRGRGDVWLSDGKKWIDVNVDGTFNYLEDKKIGLSIDVQFKQMGKGSVISSIAFRAKGKTDSAVFDFSKNKFTTYELKGKKGNFEIRGLRKERFSFEYEKESKSYMIAVGSRAKHHIGLYVDPKNPQKYIIPENQSVFENYIAYKVIKKVVPTLKQTKKAKKCCKKMKGLKRKECISDFLRTNKCLHYLTDERPHVRPQIKK
jgi:hypothetical protein